MPQPTASSAIQDRNQRVQPPTPTPIAATAVASSSRQRDPNTVDRIPEARKRKRSASPYSSVDTDSTGGDIPSRKRRATGSPESNPRTPTPEVPQKAQEPPSRPQSPPPQIIIPTFDENISKKSLTNKGEAPQKVPQKAPQKAPERAPLPHITTLQVSVTQWPVITTICFKLFMTRSRFYLCKTTGFSIQLQEKTSLPCM